MLEYLVGGPLLAFTGVRYFPRVRSRARPSAVLQGHLPLILNRNISIAPLPCSIVAITERYDYELSCSRLREWRENCAGSANWRTYLLGANGRARPLGLLALQ
jgi:hypothetical protein